MHKHTTRLLFVPPIDFSSEQIHHAPCNYRAKHGGRAIPSVRSIVWHGPPAPPQEWNVNEVTQSLQVPADKTQTTQFLSCTAHSITSLRASMVTNRLLALSGQSTIDMLFTLRMLVASFHIRADVSLDPLCCPLVSDLKRNHGVVDTMALSHSDPHAGCS
jgi:hypothetical protein